MRRFVLVLLLAALATAGWASSASALVQEDYCNRAIGAYDWCYNPHIHSYDGNVVFGGNFRKCVVLEYPSGHNVTDTRCGYGSAFGVSWSPNCCTALEAPIYNGDNNAHNMSGRASY